MLSNLFIHTPVFTPSFVAVSSTLSISLIPDTEGSATTSTISTPVMEAITGQPIPGEPSITANLGSLFIS